MSPPVFVIVKIEFPAPSQLPATTMFGGAACMAGAACLTEPPPFIIICGPWFCWNAMPGAPEIPPANASPGRTAKVIHAAHLSGSLCSYDSMEGMDAGIGFILPL